MKFSQLSIVVFSFAAVHTSLADVRVVMEENGSSSVINIGSTWASVSDQSDPDHNMLINMKNKKIYVVDHENEVVIDFSNMLTAKAPAKGSPSTAKKPKVEIQKVGPGPKFLGYETTEYKLMADGKFCSTQYFSKDLLKHKEISSFAEVVSKMDELSSGEENFGSACEYAQSEFDKNAVKYGIALLSKAADGSVSYKVREINFNMKFTTGDFALPRDYPIVTQEELMRKTEEEMQGEDDRSSHPDKSSGQGGGK